jgi:hypothetical protein
VPSDSLKDTLSDVVSDSYQGTVSDGLQQELFSRRATDSMKYLFSQLEGTLYGMDFLETISEMVSVSLGNYF